MTDGTGWLIAFMAEDAMQIRLAYLHRLGLGPAVWACARIAMAPLTFRFAFGEIGVVIVCVKFARLGILGCAVSSNCPSFYAVLIQTASLADSAQGTVAPFGISPFVRRPTRQAFRGGYSVELCSNRFIFSHVLPSFAFSVLVVSTLDGNSELHQLSAQGLLGEWVSCRQPRIGQPLSANHFNHRIQPLKAVPFDVAFVQPEGELVQITAKMFAAHAVIHAVVTAFQDRPYALNRVRVSRASRVFANRMIDRIVTEEQPVKVGEHQVLVRVELRSKFDVLMDALRGLLQAPFFHRGGDSASTAFPHSQNGNLADCPTASLEFLVFMFVAFLATDEAFVQFDDATEFRQLWPTAGFPKPMEHEPCRLLSDAYLLRQLQRRDALACGHEQVHRIEPLVQGNVAALKDRACADREIELTGVAAVETTLARGDVLFGFARRADNAVLPDAGFQKKPSRFRIGEHLEKLEGRNCAFAHGLNVLDSRTFVKGVNYIVPQS